jgi:hypothetical protein
MLCRGSHNSGMQPPAADAAAADAERYRPTTFPRCHANPTCSTRLPIPSLRGGRGRGSPAEEEYMEYGDYR